MSDFSSLSRGMRIGVSTSALALLMSATNVKAAEGQSGVIDEIVVTAHPPAYDVVDLHAEVQFGSVAARLFVKNLTDERAYTGGGVTTDGLDQPVRLDLAVLPCFSRAP